METEDFVAKRTSDLSGADKELRPLVEKALKEYPSSSWTENIITGASVLWLEMFSAEAPNTNHDAALRAFTKMLVRALKKTAAPDKPPSDAQIDRITRWVSTVTVNDATFAGNNANGVGRKKWVTMHDSHVRPTHVRADGESVPIMGTFEIGGYHLHYPGEPIGPPSIWINCRCVIQGVGKGKNMSGTSTTFDLEALTAAGLGPEDADGPLVDEAVSVPWHGVLAPMGKKSGDNRMFAENSLTNRPLPLPFRYELVGTHGGTTSDVVTVGTIDEIAYENGLALGKGVITPGPYQDMVVQGLVDGTIRGISVDADDVVIQMPEDDDEEALMAMMTGVGITTFSAARIAGATLVPIPAFHEAYVSLGDSFDEDVADCNCTGGDPDVAATAAAAAETATFAPGTHDGPGWLTHPRDTQRLRSYWTHGEGAAKIAWGTPGDFNRCRLHLGKYVAPEFLAGTCANLHKEAIKVWPGQEDGGRGHHAHALSDEAPALALVASGGVQLLDAELFKDPKLTGPTPLTVEGDHVFGHIAAWGTCHIGYDGVCSTPPHSNTNYSMFRTGVVDTTQGPVPVGQLTMGIGHASVRARSRAAMAHYDNVNLGVADVAVGEDVHGIWFSGALRPGLSDSALRQLKASAISGDWRDFGMDLDMVAALVVNTPGFPIPRPELAATGKRQTALVASGVVQTEPTSEVKKMVGIVAAVADELEFRAARKAKIAATRESTKHVAELAAQKRAEKIQAAKSRVLTTEGIE